MRKIIIWLATLLCIAAWAALIANASAGADNVHLLAGCAANQTPANVVRSAHQAGDAHAACSR